MKPIDWSKIHEERAFTLGTPFLAFASAFYGLGVRFRWRHYQNRAGRTLPGFVVSIGNLTVGGTGKTPAACMLAEWARNEGYRVAILSRGYGGHYTEKVLEVSDGDQLNAGPYEAGDEPFLMAKKLTGVPVIVSRERFRAGVYAHEKFGTHFYILDDGFQHLALKRDLDLVLLDDENPFGNGHLLPWGPLREPLSQLRRADALIITRSDPSLKGSKALELLGRRYPNRPVFRSAHIPGKVVVPMGHRHFEPGYIKGKRLMAFTGIARPGVFKETLTALGGEVIYFRGFRDHFPFTPDEIRKLIAEREGNRADLLITTEKDWVRIEKYVNKSPDIAYLTIKLDLISEKELFFNMVKDRIGGSLN